MLCFFGSFEKVNLLCGFLAHAGTFDASIIYNGRTVLGADEVLAVYRAAF